MTIAQVLKELGITEYVLRSEPTNESEFNQYFFKVVGVTENGHAVESNNSDDFGITWYEIENIKNELQAAEPLRLLRIQRDQLLSQTDYITLRAYSQGQAVPQEWADYMQALRDLPQTAEPQLDENGNLTNVEWPTKPSETE